MLTEKLVVDEKRQEHRLIAQETVFIELSSGEPGLDIPADIVIGTSVDISSNGLRAIVDRPVVVDRILRACVKFADDTPGFLLVAEVKWCQPHEQPEKFAVGLCLLESEGTDIQEWKAMIASRFADT